MSVQVCDPQTGSPILGVELNDRSHDRQDRKERDDFVSGVFEAAKLPLIALPARSAFEPLRR
ncbi:MAG: DUF2726 domain-containing protein [Deltaproteobacteria bacterium]|nr:DUF2726 domain-containing protein [Deltaproteobacteria bacterium]